MRPRSQMQAVVFFALFFFCLWLGVDVRLIYHGGGEIQGFPVFYCRWDFARDLLRHSGGLAEYLSALEMQFLFYRGLGAALLTAHAVLIFACVRSCARAADVRLPALPGYLSSLALLAIYCRYAHFASAIGSLTIVLVCLWALVRFRIGSPLVRWTAIFLLTGLLYPAAAGALPIFSASAALLAWCPDRKWRTAIWALLCGLVVPAAEGKFWYGFGTDETWRALLPVPWPVVSAKQPGVQMVIALYLVLPAVLLMTAAWQTGFQQALNRLVKALPLRRPAGEPNAGTRERSRPDLRQPKTARKASPPPPRWKLKWAVQTITLGAAVVTVFYVSHDRRLKSILQVDYFSSRGMWPQVLVAAERIPGDPFVACAAAQATFHTGRLTAKLPLLTSPEDLLLLGQGNFAHWKQSGLYLDLGFLNPALHHLTEAVEFWGERPLLLERLAIVNLALGNLNTAKLYLTALTQVPLQDAWARRQLAALASDPTASADPQVARLRSLAVKEDVVGHPGLNAQLMLLLRANPTNRMAFEYLMTYDLLTKNLADFAANLPRVKDFEGFERPALWDDALVLYAASQNITNVPGVGVPSVDSQRQFGGFVGILRRAGPNQEKVRAELEHEYGDTYFYYHLFHP